MISRRLESWRTRVAVATAFALVGSWAAIAPQIPLSLGERLHLSFKSLSVLTVVISAVCGFRIQSRFFRDKHLHLSGFQQFIGQTALIVATNARIIAAAIPFFVLLVGLDIVSGSEAAAVFAVAFLAMVCGSLIENVHISLILLLAVAVAYVAWGHNSFEVFVLILLAMHIGLKGCVTFAAIRATHGFPENLHHEAATPIRSFEWTQIYRDRLWGMFKFPIALLAGANLSLILALASGVAVPATLEQKFALSLASAAGIGLLLVDLSALVWRGLLSGVILGDERHSFVNVFASIMGVPWVVGWALNALHGGEAVTLNEAAAYFVVWTLIGASISSTAGAAAKDRLQREFRELVSAAHFTSAARR